MALKSSRLNIDALQQPVRLRRGEARLGPYATPYADRRYDAQVEGSSGIGGDVIVLPKHASLRQPRRCDGFGA
jgi:hypothetical protein